MASRNDKTWNENFACYMDYVNTYHRLPPPRAMHNGVAVGGWLRNQINFYKRNELPKEREEQLNAFTRAWISGGKERRKQNQHLLLVSEWKSRVPSNHTSIDKFLSAEEVYSCIRKGIVDCEGWANSNYTKVKPCKMHECYAVSIPFYDKQYAPIFYKIIEQEIGDFQSTAALIQSFDFSESDRMGDRIERMLNLLDQRERFIIKMYYGLNEKKKCHTLKEISVKIDTHHDNVRKIRNKALKALRKTSALSILYAKPIQASAIDDLELSSRTQNCLQKEGISTLDELIYIVENDIDRLENIAYLGKKMLSEIVNKLIENKLTQQNKLSYKKDAPHKH